MQFYHKDFMFSFFCYEIRCWTNSQVVSNLRYHDTRVTSPCYSCFHKYIQIMYCGSAAISDASRLSLMFKLLSSFTVISDIYVSSIPNKTTFVEYCLTQCISKLLGSFEIHWVRQHLVKFMGLAGMVNAIVYKIDPFFTGLGHGELV